MEHMQLLIMVLNDVDLLNPLLESLMEKGIRGATILSSTGMARELAKDEDFPLFGSLRIWLDPERQESKTIFMALKEKDVPVVKKVVHDVVGDLSKPDTGIIFTLPILDIEGIGGKA